MRRLNADEIKASFHGIDNTRTMQKPMQVFRLPQQIANRREKKYAAVKCYTAILKRVTRLLSKNGSIFYK